MNPKRIEGWQFHVDVYDDYVIKIPKSKNEISEKVLPWLQKQNKVEELDARVNSLHSDIINSIELIKQSSIQFELLGNPEFLEDGTIKQDKAVILEELIKKYLDEGDVASAKKLIDDFISLTLELWRHGICEKTFKFGINFGKIADKVVLIDLCELTGNKITVEKLIRTRACDRPWGLEKIYPSEIATYYIEQSQKHFTLQNLELLWRASATSAWLGALD